jgi:tight adherence protein C
VPIDPIALVIAAGFVLALACLGATLHALVAEERSAASLLRRRLSAGEVPDLLARQRVIARVAEGLTPLARLAGRDKGPRRAVRGKLVQAGFRGAHASQVMLAVKLALALGGSSAVLWVSSAGAAPLPMLPVVAALAAAVGFLLPNVWLGGRVQARRNALYRALPDAMDLLVTSVEAGLGLDAALQRVAAEIAFAQPLLAEELKLTFLEVKAGVARPEALRRLAARTGVQDLKTLAVTLAQTELFGTSVATALRIQAEGMRMRRLQRAEERAAMLSVKMTVPLVVCFLPAVVAVLLGPAVVNIVINLLARGAP